jgi:hypothetical protein
VFPLSLYEEDFNVYFQGVDLKTDTTIREEREQRGVAILRDLLGLGTVRSRRSISKIPWTFMSPRIDINPSGSAVRTRKVSPTTIHANPSLIPLTLLPSLRCPTSAIRQLFLSLDCYIVNSFHRPRLLLLQPLISSGS